MFIKEITTESINGGAPVVTPNISSMTNYEVYTYFRTNKRSVIFNLDVQNKSIADLIEIGAITDYTNAEIGAPVGYFPKRAGSDVDFLVNTFTYITPDINTNIDFKLHLFNNENSGPNLNDDDYTIIIDDSDLYVRLNAPTEFPALTVFGTLYTGPVEKIEYSAQFAASGESGKVAIDGASLSIIDNSGDLLYKLPTTTGDDGQFLQINHDKTCTWANNIMTSRYIGENFSVLFKKTFDLIETFVYKFGTISFGEQMQILIPDNMIPTCNIAYIGDNISFGDFTISYSVNTANDQYFLQVIVTDVVVGGSTINLNNYSPSFSFQYY